ncbi:hypothetical protein A2856_02040 [Candidatus Uhrbacteria bacterium RIFCSPHIGHO2_01_FULL_63_20]|uniref:DUF3179 domain-containing protein n=1 Tax=Candidatus Uhrbacteria bacterium RIFCSPHIGHO2_01_FULL_63_20 TaxID=1802385 RepID=A0A1F7TKE3_9BACT|nr:MAG: hypothetical protein A2856_02040 [Candidatus Uhrbacteria bacterium RIFCSPHIGHO2_01_FULL_63_20]
MKGKDIAWILATVLAAGLVVGWRYRDAHVPPQASAPQPRVIEAVEAGSVPVISDPKVERTNLADQYLQDAGEGVVVGINGRERFYPFQILAWHPAVNDTLAGTPILVSYGPLSGTVAVFERRVRGAETTFAATGGLWNNAPVLSDATGSAWIAATGTAISGPLKGERLRPLPSTVMRWSAWKGSRPNGEVLSRDTGFERDYTRDPYADASGMAVWYPVDPKDARLPAKTSVVGVLAGGAAKAYPLESVRVVREIDDSIGGVGVRLAYDEDLGTVSVEDADGEPLPATMAYWFFWAATYPQTQIFENP